MQYSDLINREIEFIKSIPTDSVEKMVDLISSRLPFSRVVTCGMGKAGQIAHTLSTTLSSTGTPSFFIHPAEAQHGDLGSLVKGDVVIVISNSGMTREVLEFMDLARNLHPYISIYGIVGNPENRIARECQHSIIYGPVTEICPFGLTPTTSTTCMSVICDLIVVGLMEKINFTKEEYSKFHHGGYIGTKAKE